MVMTGFRGPQVCKIVGISYRQLDYWARTDLLRPSLADAAGSGTQRRYSYRDLVALKVIKNLLDAGISLQTARAPSSTSGSTWGRSWPRPAWSSTVPARCWPAAATRSSISSARARAS